LKAKGDLRSEGDLKRVLLVSPVGEHGGAEQVFLTLAKHLPAYGIEPVLACMRPGPLLERARGQGLAAHAYQEHRYRDLHHIVLGTIWLRKLIRRERIDLVHSNLTAHLYGGAAARLSHTPELWHIHDYPYELDSINRLALRLPTDFALFTTKRVKSGFPALHAGPHGVVHPVCTDPERLMSYPAQPEIAARYGLPSGPLLLTVARLQEHKGHRYLLEAVPAVLCRYPNAAFAIVGKASGPDQERYLAELQARCTQLGIADSVRFLGYVPDADLIALYRKATALVHPALSEGFGLTLLDAMTLGAPVIAAAADGPKELIEPEHNGLLVPPGDSDALAAAILRVLSVPELAAAWGREGKSYASALSATHMARQTAEIYRTVIH
jgi:glycosyltransferase involved in cell wall biosynthesis